MQHGKDLIVTIGGAAVAASKSCKIKVDQSFIDACSPTDGRTKLKISTGYGWSVNCSNLCANMEDANTFLAAAKNGTVLSLSFFNSGLKQKGQALVSSWEVTGQVGSLLTLAVNFTGSGPLEDARSEGPEYVNGTLYTYSDYNAETQTLAIGGELTDGVWTRNE